VRRGTVNGQRTASGPAAAHGVRGAGAIGRPAPTVHRPTAFVNTTHRPGDSRAARLRTRPPRERDRASRLCRPRHRPAGHQLQTCARPRHQLHGPAPHPPTPRPLDAVRPGPPSTKLEEPGRTSVSTVRGVDRSTGQSGRKGSLDVNQTIRRSVRARPRGCHHGLRARLRTAMVARRSGRQVVLSSPHHRRDRGTVSDGPWCRPR
jgi:hypothetical protein